MSGPIHRVLAAHDAELDLALAEALADPQQADAESFATFRAGLERRLESEEQVLVPALRRATGGELSGLARLRADDARARVLSAGAPSPSVIEELRVVLAPAARAASAPGGFYETCDRVLGGAAEAIASELAARLTGPRSLPPSIASLTARPPLPAAPEPKAAKKSVAKKPAKAAGQKSRPKQPAVKQPVAKRRAAKKSAAKKSTAKKSAGQKSRPKKSAKPSRR